MTTKYNFTKVLWFSRHKMTKDQFQALEKATGGQVEIHQYSGSPENVHVPFVAEVSYDGFDGEPTATLQAEPLKELVKKFDVIAIVAPIGLQQQILSVSGCKPVIMALSKREQDGTFVFQKWERLVKIDVVKEDFC